MRSGKNRQVPHHAGMAGRVVPLPDGAAPAPAAPAGERSVAVDVHQLPAGHRSGSAQ